MQLNREKLAEFLGCSLRTIDEYRRQGMPGDAPKRPGGQWRFGTAAVVQWLRDRERQNAIGEIDQIDEAEAKRRKLAAEAAKAEFELAKLEGEAVGIADFEATWSAMIGAARAKLLGLGSKLGPQVALIESTNECKCLIDESVAEALLELTEFEPDLHQHAECSVEPSSGYEEAVPAMGAAAGPDGKRVGRRGSKA